MNVSLRTNNRRVPSHNRRRNRRGVALILALLCLTVSASLMVNMAKTIRLDRTQRASQQRALQTTWLARHGLENAMKLVENPDYSGGTWQLSVPAQPRAITADSAIQLPAKQASSISVAVNREEEKTTITVSAKFPHKQPDQTIKTITKTLPPRLNKADLE